MKGPRLEVINAFVYLDNMLSSDDSLDSGLVWFDFFVW